MRLNQDATLRANMEAMENGKLGRRFEIIVRKEAGSLAHSRLIEILFQAGIAWVSVGTDVVCLPCRGRGVVDDGTANGCLRTTMPCPDCLGTGNFKVFVS